MPVFRRHDTKSIIARACPKLHQQVSQMMMDYTKLRILVREWPSDGPAIITDNGDDDDDDGRSHSRANNTT